MPTLPDAPWVSDGRAQPALLTGIWAGISVRYSDTREGAMAELRRIAERDSDTASV